MNAKIYIALLVIYIIIISVFTGTQGSSDDETFIIMWHLSNSGILIVSFSKWSLFCKGNLNKRVIYNNPLDVKILKVLIKVVIGLKSFYFLMLSAIFLKFRFAVWLYREKEILLCVMTLFIIAFFIISGILSMIKKKKYEKRI